MSPQLSLHTSGMKQLDYSGIFHLCKITYFGRSQCSLKVLLEELADPGCRASSSLVLRDLWWHHALCRAGLFMLQAADKAWQLLVTSGTVTFPSLFIRTLTFHSFYSEPKSRCYKFSRFIFFHFRGNNWVFWLKVFIFVFFLDTRMNRDRKVNRGACYITKKFKNSSKWLYCCDLKEIYITGPKACIRSEVEPDIFLFPIRLCRLLWGCLRCSLSTHSLCRGCRALFNSWPPVSLVQVALIEMAFLIP